MSDWETCSECLAMGRTHVTQTDLESDPIGTWRRHWRGDELAVRWFDHPCDDPPKAWAVFTAWGVDEVSHVYMQESTRITTDEAVAELTRIAGPCRSSVDRPGGAS